MIVDVAFGFLGSGKTTFITRVLQTWGTDEKIVVLVNEFGDVGIDGELLASQGSNVVEMPSGCICCTLQSDFRNQIFEIERAFHPDRLIIEPSGVATISTIDWILKAQTLEPVIDEIHKILIVDATGFKSLYKANRRYIESQVEGAHLVVLNKCDRVDKRKAMLTQAAISSINPELTVFMSEFGAVDWGEYQFALSVAPVHKKGESKKEEHRTALGGEDHPHRHGEVEILPHVEAGKDALGYESFGCVFGDNSFDRAALEKLFLDLGASRSKMGEIVRAKGIFGIGGKWVLMELASGEFSSQPLKRATETKITVIGKGIDREMIGAAFKRCIEA